MIRKILVIRNYRDINLIKNQKNSNHLILRAKMRDKKTVAFIMSNFERSMYAKVHCGFGKLGLAICFISLVLSIFLSFDSRIPNGAPFLLIAAITSLRSFSCYFIGFLLDKLHEIAFYSQNYS